MATLVQYRTAMVEEQRNFASDAQGKNAWDEFWYTGDNRGRYESVEDAFANSDVVNEWRDVELRGTLTAVRLLDSDTGAVQYVSPSKE